MNPRSFITTVPHMSFVWGDENVNFLRARYAALQQSTLFRGMRYSEDHAQIKEWAPLVMEGRDPKQKVAATRTEIGTDVNYGEITRQLIASLQEKAQLCAPAEYRSAWLLSAMLTIAGRSRSPI
ncbi:malate:quinone oxidoreductase [Citrobacter freundii]|nr:malate:quinone oxidoreductase [Citrobacter freundii]